MDNLGGDNKMQNTPAEIYANVRNKALDEAAQLCEMVANNASNQAQYGSHNAAISALAAGECMRRIRALKTERK